jgi:hypothetical protein
MLAFALALNSCALGGVIGVRDFEAHGNVVADVYYFVNSTNCRGDAGYLRFDSTWLNGYILQSVRTEFSVAGMYKQRLRLELGLMGDLWFTTPSPTDIETYQRRASSGGLRHVCAGYAFGSDPAEPAAKITVGYFPIDYAPESRTFGGYLFKTGAYPGWILSGEVDARLAGLMLEARFPKLLSHMLLLTSEMEYNPKYDISLSYIAKAQPVRLFSLSCGVMFDRCIPFDKDLTRPASAKSNVPHSDKEATGLLIRTGYRDPADSSITWYRKSGVKLMARIAFDFKKLFATDRFGKNDFLLYGEAALLGAKNYPGYYENISERVPVMLGLNIPVFGLLDVFTIEGEYYGSPWKNDASKQYYPTPYTDWNFTDIEDPKAVTGDKGEQDNFKWSVYAEKSLWKLSLFALAASDHMRAPTGGDGVEPPELLHAPDEWYLRAGVRFRF